MQKGIQENVYQFATVFTKTHRIYMACRTVFGNACIRLQYSSQEHGVHTQHSKQYSRIRVSVCSCIRNARTVQFFRLKVQRLEKPWLQTSHRSTSETPIPKRSARCGELLLSSLRMPAATLPRCLPQRLWSRWHCPPPHCVALLQCQYTERLRSQLRHRCLRGQAWHRAQQAMASPSLGTSPRCQRDGACLVRRRRHLSPRMLPEGLWPTLSRKKSAMGI